MFSSQPVPPKPLWSGLYPLPFSLPAPQARAFCPPHPRTHAPHLHGCKPPTCDSQCCPSKAQTASPPAPRFPCGDYPPPHSSFSVFHILALPLPLRFTAPAPCRFLPKPPSHGGWRTCLCPALHPANPEVGRKRTREGEPQFSLFSFFLTVHSFFFP